MALTPSAFFVKLGAPLKNVMWSWGAQRDDGTIFLRAWGDEMCRRDGRTYFRLVNRRAYEGVSQNHGYNERLVHLDKLSDGAPGYVVMCTAVDPSQEPREIKSFDERQVFKLGPIELIGGDEWAEVVARVDVKSITGARGGVERGAVGSLG